MPIPTAEEKLKWIKVVPPTQEELDAVAKLSPGDYEIGFQRTNDILDEALEVFQRSCRSSMGIAGDVMVAIFTAQGDLVNGAAGTYLHAIIQPILIKYILTHYSKNPGIKEGDVWVANDALYGGIHNPDYVALVPVFYQGRLIAWCGAANHTTETGAVEPGGMPVMASARFAEGMNLPPMKVGENGQLREDWLELFNAYGIRAPQMVVTDLKARSTAADRARVGVVELAGTHLLYFDELDVPVEFLPDWESAMVALWKTVHFHGALPVLSTPHPVQFKDQANAPLICLKPASDKQGSLPGMPFALSLPTMGETFPDVSRWLQAKQCALVTTDGEIPYQLEIQKLEQRVATMRSLCES